MRQNSSERERTRFAFVAHPLSAGDLRRFDPSLEGFSDEELERLRSSFTDFLNPLPLDEFGISSADGRLAEGELILLPRLPSELLALSWEDAVDLVQSAVDLAVDRGADVVGLGGFSSIIADGGLTLRAPTGVSITSGNSFTTWAAIRAVEAACTNYGLVLADCTVAIVGAAGVIGHALSLLCAERAGELILVGNPRAGDANVGKLRELAQDCKRHVVSLAASGRDFLPDSFAGRLVRRQPFAIAPASELELGLTTTTDIDRYLPGAHIILTATNAVLPFISSRHLRDGAMVCDVSRPHNIASDLADERSDLRLLNGGLVRAPEASILGLLEERDKPNVLVACAAETIILALSRYRSRHLCGQLDVTAIGEIGQLAERLGFSIAT